MTEFARKGLLLDFGGVISVTLFERHALSEQALGLPAGTLNWRGPFDPEGDRLWADMLADRIAERDYWSRRASEVGRLCGEDWDMLTLIRRTCGPDANRHSPTGGDAHYPAREGCRKTRRYPLQ